MFGLGLPELIVIFIIVGLPIGGILLFILISSNSQRKTILRIASNKTMEVAMFCSKCGREISERSSFCQHCGGSLSTTPSNMQSPIMTSGLTVEDFKTFVGKNSEKYLPKFAKFNVGDIDSFKATWHWPAFFIPFWWLLYRKLYGWAVLAFFLSIIPYLGLLTGFVWAVVANRLYYNHAKKKLFEIKQLHPAPETQKAVITVTGGVGNAVLIIGVVIGMFAVIGILAAIAIPGYLGMQERARKGAITRTMASDSSELQAWLNSSLKGKGGSLREAREVDTDGNGNINNDDMTNAELLNKGVCNQYVMMKTSAGMEKSPWDPNITLWSINGGNGQVQCTQTDDNGITLTAFDKNGGVIDTKTITE